MDLFSAIRAGDISRVRERLSEGVDLRQPGDGDVTPLVVAIEEGNEEIVQLLLAKGADPNFGYCMSPLNLACAKGSLGIVDMLLKAGADPNDRDEDGDYCLSSAVFSGSIAVVKAIIDAGATADAFRQAYDRYQHSWCHEHRLDEVIQFLRKVWPDTPTLAEAVAAGDVAAVESLVQAGADPDDPGHITPPLIAAAEQGHLRMVDLLLVLGADPNMRDGDYRTALMKAAGAGHLEVVRRLLRAAANPKIDDNRGSSPVVYAAENGHREIVDLLAPLSTSAMRERAMLLLQQADNPRPRTGEPD